MDRLLDMFEDRSKEWRIGICIFIIVETCLVIGATIAIILQGEPDANDVASWKPGSVLILGAVCFCYFVIDAVINENKFSLLSFAVATCVYTAYVVSDYILFEERSKLETIRLIAVCSFQLFNIVISIITYKAPGWKIYKMIGADADLVRSYKTYQIFTTLVRINLMFILLFVTMSVILVDETDESQTLYYVVGGTVAGVNIIVTILGYIAVFSIKNSTN
eukprot:TRINITY_DN7295_c0_g1_i1.p1 TRINITY_DN7295_c0_g1~~TRINITY_DN7295_c0_g1_i1.p1  ORF type:complete len:220 (-),score=26.83 TRINITY_DN7295_c0_g1_i1:343-1002(-)